MYRANAFTPYTLTLARARAKHVPAARDRQNRHTILPIALVYNHTHTLSGSFASGNALFRRVFRLIRPEFTYSRSLPARRPLSGPVLDAFRPGNSPPPYSQPRPVNNSN
jgi:hypothetical protein